MTISKDAKQYINEMVIDDIKVRMKFATSMKNTFKKDTPDYQFWSGKHRGLRQALISVQHFLKEAKTINPI
jgi:hypothetical protein